MKYRLPFLCAALAASFLAVAEETTDAVSAEIAVAEKVVKDQKKDDAKWYFTLPLCRRVHGSGEVLAPGAKEWKPIEEGRFYPLGSSFRAAKDKGLVVISFGKECSVTVEDGSSFSTRPQALGEKSRTIALTGGEVSIVLPGNLPAGLFAVTTSAFTARNLAGESKFTYTDKGDGFEADVRCVTGMIEIEGRHYKVPSMRAADIIRIRSSHDDLETILYGKSGDFVVRLDRGIAAVSEVQQDGSVKDVVQPGFLDWHLSVATRVQINRSRPPIGERLSVVMMTFDSAGAMKNHFAFAEGRPEVNSGELVLRTEGEKADVAKRAAEVTTEEKAAETETTDAKADAEETTEEKPAEEESSDAKAETTEEN